MILVISSTVIGSPIGSIFGDFACSLYWGVNVSGPMARTVMSFGMAIYRFLLMKFQHVFLNKFGHRGSLCLTILSDVLLFSLALCIYWRGSMLKNESMLISYCQGKPYAQKANFDIDFIHGQFLQTLMLLLMLCLTVIEISLYAVLSIDFHWQNKSMTGKISKDSLTKRHRGNVMTFTGQIMSNILALIGIIAASMIVNMVSQESNMLLFATIATPTMYSITQLLASRELRRHVMMYL